MLKCTKKQNPEQANFKNKRIFSQNSSNVFLKTSEKRVVELFNNLGNFISFIYIIFT